MNIDQQPITLAYIKELRVSGQGKKAEALMTAYFATSRKQKALKRKEIMRDDARKHAAHKRSQGLCIIFGCVRPNVQGLAGCSYHLAKHRERYAQQKDKRIKGLSCE